MKARDIDTAMSIIGALVTLTLIILKGFQKLALDTNDCFIAGLMIACCTKFIAVARVLGVLKGDPTAVHKEINDKNF